MIQFIDPSAPSANEEIRRVRAGDTRTAPYRPSIAPQLADLFSAALPAEEQKPSPALVDWSFLDQDDGQPGEPADWVKKQARMFGGEIAEDLMQRHCWTRQIPPPSTPPRYDPNEPPFDAGDILGSEELEW
jgi:hypothetical protein